MKVLELFSGYGTASFALKQLGINFEIIGYSDIDKYANECFWNNHWKNVKPLRFTNNPPRELGDVTKIDPNKLEDFDLLTGGFPCQAFSLSGKGLGELDTRGTLFNEIIRIAEVKKPGYIMLENVRGLLANKHETTLKKILSELKRIGYYVYMQVLDTKDFGVPQSRRRVFFICFREKVDFDCFVFPQKEELKLNVEDILEKNIDEKYYLKENNIKRLLTSSDLNKKFSVINPKIAITQTARQYDNWKGNYIQDENGIRKLTPKKCFRLMGFLNDEINLEGISDRQAYKLAGNGQSLNVVKNIFENMFKSSLNLKKENSND